MATKKTTKKTAKKTTKKAAYRNVSERLGLTRLEKATPKACRERAKVLETMIAKNKVPKALLAVAKRWVYVYRARAKSA